MFILISTFVDAKFNVFVFYFLSFQTSSTTKTTTLTTPAKLYGKDLSEYDEVDVDALLAQLSPEEINILAKEVDPDVSSVFSYNLIIYINCVRQAKNLKLCKNNSPP